MDLTRISIVGPLFVGSLWVVTAGAFAASVCWWRRRWVRSALWLVALALVVGSVAAQINARYDYLPTVGALLGERAADQVSTAGFHRLEHAIPRPLPSTARGRVEAAAEPVRSLRLTHGVVVPFVIPGRVSGFGARTGQVYVPPAWFRWPRPRLPVIELLHGTPGSPADWTRAGLADTTVDAYARLHAGIAPILVMPDVNGSWFGDTECVDGRRGNAETYLTRDVRAAVVALLGTRADAGGWAIAGLSEGGYCALQLGLRHPDLFAGAGDYSGENHPTAAGGLSRLFRGSPAQVRATARGYEPYALLSRWWTRHAHPPPALWFSAGASDGVLGGMRSLRALAQRDGFTATLHVIGDRHDFRDWRTAFADSLPWMMSRLQPAPPRRAPPVDRTV